MSVQHEMSNKEEFLKFADDKYSVAEAVGSMKGKS